MKNFLMLLFAFFAITNLLATEQTQKNGSPQQEKKVKVTSVGIDIRTSMELQSNPAPGAIHIPLSNIEGEIASKVPDKNTEVLLFCESGRRAGMALKALKSMGYKNVKNIGSWRDWNASQKAKDASK